MCKSLSSLQSVYNQQCSKEQRIFNIEVSYNMTLYVFSIFCFVFVFLSPIYCEEPEIQVYLSSLATLLLVHPNTRLNRQHTLPTAPFYMRPIFSIRWLFVFISRQCCKFWNYLWARNTYEKLKGQGRCPISICDDIC